MSFILKTIRKIIMNILLSSLAVGNRSGLMRKKENLPVSTALMLKRSKEILLVG